MIEVLYSYLLEKYGTNEPIMLNEISYKNYSQAWIYKQLNKLCDEEKLMKFEKGIYYIPTKTVFGNSSLNPNKVIKRKYLYNGEEAIGFYSGLTLQNQLKLTTQVPNILEIFTNNEKSRVREVIIGNQKVILRKARVTINNDNIDILSFLELMNSISVEDLNEYKSNLLKEYMADKKISRKSITKYAPIFPDKVMRNLIESELIYNVAQ